MESCDNLAHGTRATVNHHPKPSRVILLQFDEVITATQRSQLISPISKALFQERGVAQGRGPQFFGQNLCPSVLKRRDLTVQLFDQALSVALRLEELRRVLEANGG